MHIKKHIHSYKHAFRGLSELIALHNNFQIEILAAVAVILLGLFFNLSITEWVATYFCIGVVLITEALNTAIEEVCNAVDRNHNETIRISKDIAAASVLISGFMSLAIGLLIFVPHFLLLFRE